MNKTLMLGIAAISMGVAVPAMAEGGKYKGKDMFAYHDTNSDGMISKEEFLSKAEERFAKLDADGNGNISKAEHDAKKAEWKEKMKEHREKKMKDAPDVMPPETE